MLKIGGNTTAKIQTKTTAKNAIGERIPQWGTIQTLVGFLDLQTGVSDRNKYDSKFVESTHVFICDYAELTNFSIENGRMEIDGSTYDVLYVDNPMGLNYHLEFFLKFTGGIAQ